MAVCSLAAGHDHGTNTGLSTVLVVVATVVVEEVTHTHIHCALVELGDMLLKVQ